MYNVYWRFARLVTRCFPSTCARIRPRLYGVGNSSVCNNHRGQLSLAIPPWVAVVSKRMSKQTDRAISQSRMRGLAMQPGVWNIYWSYHETYLSRIRRWIVRKFQTVIVSTVKICIQCLQAVSASGDYPRHPAVASAGPNWRNSVSQALWAVAPKRKFLAAPLLKRQEQLWLCTFVVHE